MRVEGLNIRFLLGFHVVFRPQNPKGQKEGLPTVEDIDDRRLAVIDGGRCCCYKEN